VAPSLRPLLQGELELRATLTLRDDGRFTDAGVLWYAGDVALTDHEVRDLARSHGGFLRSRSGTWFRADPTQVQAVVREIEGLGLDTGASTRLLRPEARSLLEKIPADANLALADSAQPLAERILRTPLDPPLALPEHLEPVLRPYQKHGFEFLSDRQRYRVGAVLADDMGLGKTLQVLSLLEAFYASGPRAHSGAERLRSLVICPASVVMVWVQQAALFCPGLRCRAYQGNPETRAEILGADDWDVLVLNYALARNDSEALLGAAYQFVVLDEAQQIKNPDSQIAQVSRSLRANQPLALTGTPLENRLLDLWSIMEFVNPGFLGSRQAFLDRYDNPAGYQRLAHRIRPAILRRTKELVAPELPPRTEEVVVVEMGSEQRRLYEAERQQARELLRTRGPVEVLAALTRLRQFCCHPDLVLKNGKVDQAAKVDELCDRLEELLAENHSVLVFSQFTEMLKRLEPVLEARGMPFLKITGSTPAPERARLVEAFNSSDQAQVFLLSLRAAGTGLTLTRADYVFIFDPWWNPAVERQAIDRTHRIGQDKPVFAYRLVAQGTVEERVLALQAEKARLSAEVLADTDSGGGFAQRLTREDLERLLE
jgi:SNF2 family DNA or RNA helicase